MQRARASGGGNGGLERFGEMEWVRERGSERGRERRCGMEKGRDRFIEKKKLRHQWGFFNHHVGVPDQEDAVAWKQEGG